MSSTFEQTSTRIVYRGKIATVCIGTFRHEDGEEVTREWVEHTGAVAIVAHDDDQLYLVRQPRESVGVPDLLEIPAGKLDVEGEDLLEAAKRELAEEIGKAAAKWESLGSFFTSPGFSNEEVHLFEATELSDASGEAEENERIEVVTYPLSAIDQILADSSDSKTLIGLARLRERLN